jgi:hypothetical protein
MRSIVLCIIVALALSAKAYPPLAGWPTESVCFVDARATAATPGFGINVFKTIAGVLEARPPCKTITVRGSDHIFAPAERDCIVDDRATAATPGFGIDIFKTVADAQAVPSCKTVAARSVADNEEQLVARVQRAVQCAVDCDRTPDVRAAVDACIANANAGVRADAIRIVLSGTCQASALPFPQVAALVYVGPAVVTGSGYANGERLPPTTVFRDLRFDGAGTTDQFFWDPVQRGTVAMIDCTLVNWMGEYALGIDGDSVGIVVLRKLHITDTPGRPIYLRYVFDLEVSGCRFNSTRPELASQVGITIEASH